MAKYLPKKAFDELFKQKLCPTDWDKAERIFSQYSNHKLSVEAACALWYAVEQNRVSEILQKMKKYFFENLNQRTKTTLKSELISPQIFFAEMLKTGSNIAA